MGGILRMIQAGAVFFVATLIIAGHYNKELASHTSGYISGALIVIIIVSILLLKRATKKSMSFVAHIMNPKLDISGTVMRGVGEKRGKILYHFWHDERQYCLEVKAFNMFYELYGHIVLEKLPESIGEVTFGPGLKTWNRNFDHHAYHENLMVGKIV